MKKAIAIALFTGLMLGRTYTYPTGISVDFTLPWEIPSVTCRDVGFEIQPEFGPFIGYC